VVSVFDHCEVMGGVEDDTKLFFTDIWHIQDLLSPFYDKHKTYGSFFRRELPTNVATGSLSQKKNAGSLKKSLTRDRTIV